MRLDPAIQALRTGVARSARPTTVLRVQGEHAFDLLDAVSPRPLFLRDGQALHTLFLDEGAHPFADVYIACDDLDYLLFAEGPAPDALIDWLTTRAARPDPAGNVPARLEFTLTDLTSTHTLVSLDGPYAWECLGRLVGPEVVGVPYMSLFFLPTFGGLGLRAGKTGEYGYDLLIPNEALPAFEEALREPAEVFGAEHADLDVLDLCALENGFFSIRTPGVERLTPVELQLQWRVDRRRMFPGRQALEGARDANVSRVTWFRGPVGSPPCLPGTVLTLEGDVVGEVLVARTSGMLDAPVGQALLTRAVAHPGLTLHAGGNPSPLWTVSAPVLQNRSLFVNAQRHAWASRGVDTFPPITQPWSGPTGGRGGAG